MEDSFGNRLQEIINYKMLTGSRFAKEIGISPQLLNAYLRNERTPSIKIVKLIAVRFPEIDTRWLLTGDGTMLAMKQLSIFPEWNEITEESDKSEKDISIVSRLLSVVEKQQDTINQLSMSISEIKWFLEKKFGD